MNRWVGAAVGIVLCAAGALAAPKTAALSAAARAGDLATVRALLDKGTPVDERDEVGATALVRAASGGHLEVARELLDRKADPNASTKDGYGALHYSMEHAPSLAMAELLLARGARPDGPNPKKVSTPLQLLLQQHSAPAVVKLLLDKGANANAGEGQQSCAVVAVLFWQEESLRDLLAHGAKPDVNKDFGRKTTLLQVGVNSGKPGLVKLLLDLGADPNLRFDKKNSALAMSVIGGKAEIAKLLLERGADPKVKNEQGESAIDYAARYGRGEILDLMRAKAAPLMVAVKAGDAEAVKKALEAGADPNEVDDRGLTPLDNAASEGKLELVELLLAKGAKIEPAGDTEGNGAVWRAVYGRHVPVIKRLLAAGARGAGRDKWSGRTLVMLAAENRDGPEILEMLIAAGAKADDADKNGLTALHVAAAGGPPRTIERLLELKLAVDARANDGTTPLMLAAANERPDVVPLLLARGADANAKAKDGRTALAATLCKQYETPHGPENTGPRDRMKVAVVKALLAEGAEPGHVDCAKSWAAWAGSPEIVQVLERAIAASAGSKATASVAAPRPDDPPDALVRALAAPDRAVRFRAAALLAQRGAPDAALEAIFTALGGSASAPVAEVLPALAADASKLAPPLIARLRTRPAGERMRIAEALARAPDPAELTGVWLALLAGPDASMRRLAIGTLNAAVRGPDAASHVLKAVEASPQSFADALRDEDGQVRAEALDALVKLGAVPEPVRLALEEALRAGTPAQRGAMLAKVASLGAALRPAAPSLRTHLTDPSAGVRRGAVIALAAAGPGELADWLAPLAKDAEPPVRLAVVESGAAPALLATALRDADAGVRRAAAAKIERFGLAAKPALGALRERLLDRETAVKIAAARAIGVYLAQLEELGRQAVWPEPAHGRPPGALALEAELREPVLALLSEKDAALRALGLSLLEALRVPGAALERAVPLLADPDASVRSAASRLLGHARSLTLPALDSLRPLLAHENVDVRRAALDVVRALGETALPLLPDVLKRVDDKDDTARFGARQALAMGPGAATLAAARVVDLIEKDPEGYSYARILASYGRAAAPVVPRLLKLAEGKNENAARDALEAAAQLAPELAVAQLRQARGRMHVPAFVYDALGRLGPAVADLLPRFDELTDVEEMMRSGRALYPAVEEAACVARAAWAVDGRVTAARVRAMIAGMGGREPDEPERLAAALVAMGPAVRPLLPPLKPGEGSDFDLNRPYVYVANRRDLEKSLPKLIARLRTDADAGEAAAATAALVAEPDLAARLVAAPGKLLDAITSWNMSPASLRDSMIASDSAYVRQRTLLLVGRAGTCAPAVATAALGALTDADPWTRLAALRALGSVTSPTGEVLKALTERLRAPEWAVRWTAAQALACMGTAAEPAAEALRACAKDEDADVRAAAALALEAIEPATKR